MSETSAAAVPFVIAQAPGPTGHGADVPEGHSVAIGTPPVESHGAGFPPFDATTFPSQLIWLAIAFGALYWLMSRIALPRIAGILEDRHDRIADDQEEAGRLTAESRAAADAYEQALNGARAKAHTIASETRDALSAKAEASRKALEDELAAKLGAAETQIAATKTAAMSNVKGIAVDAADAIVRELAGIVPAAEAVESAVEAAIKKVGA